ncbi:hypothetical protein ACP70R_045791 [Stipagrostis hirtigluma subsp. patula]
MFVQNPAGEIELAVPPPQPRLVPGAPGTRLGLGFRGAQAVFSSVAFVVMLCARDSTAAFMYVAFLVATAGVQFLWSAILVVLDLHALRYNGALLQNRRVICSIATGDVIVAGIAFAGASASSGVATLINYDLQQCSINRCGIFNSATGMAFMGWFAIMPCLVLNFRSMASG